MNAQEKNANRIAIIAGSFMLMSSMVISAILANIKQDFSDVSVNTVQLVLTIPSLMGMLFAFLAGPMSIKFAKKNLLFGGMFLGLLGGILAFFFGPQSLAALFISSAFIGINQGMNGSLTKALVSDFFVNQERDDMMGYQASASTGGAIILTFCAGLLSGISWKWSYAILLLFVPALFLVQKNLTFVAPVPVRKGTDAKGGDKLNGAVFFASITVFFSYLFLYTYQLNVSLYIQTSGLGTSVIVGYANTIFPVAGMLTGLIFGKLRKKLGNSTMQVGIVMTALGFLGIKFIGTLPAIFFASFCAGAAQAFIIPSAVLIVSLYAPASIRATGISITMGLLNFGMFCSPFVINGVSTAIGGNPVDMIANKYLVAAIGMIILAVVYTVLSPVFYKKEKLADNLAS
ncbi:MFS transporter [Clostridium sp. KNHs216]|uniref:MFS transporter n=1 Tax=Clostridium sp. KNHs216 TaxID=1550235 RepID=UPI0011536C4E|nr:MFS transporter [Clostridium sp. KNHs216]TQI67832.1 putative MFS family arabinose efflux permease [Clostridium sp. KNHs216]